MKIQKVIMSTLANGWGTKEKMLQTSIAPLKIFCLPRRS